MRKSRLIDFDDMLTYTYELFSERKDILRAWQEKYKYILIDEFQDINRIQYEIIKMMALPENNLFIVGDDDQSIYRFRGSKPEIMLNFRKDYPDAKQILLDTNYRCGKYIVETSKNLISYNEERYDKAIIAASHDETPVKYAVFENTKDEVIYIIRQISELTKQGKDFKDIAVLFRTNTQARSLIEQLITYNVPFQTRDNIPNIYEHWIARDLFSYIKIAIGSRERKDFLRIINRPKRYISRNSLYGPYISFDEWIKLYDEQPWIAERIEKLLTETDYLQPKTRAVELVNNFIKPGLEDLCVSRTTFKWSIPVDFDPKHVTYVWLDALTNYITAIGYDPDKSFDEQSEKFRSLWPADVHIIGLHTVQLSWIDDQYLTCCHIIIFAACIHQQMPASHIDPFHFLMPVDRKVKSVRYTMNPVLAVRIFLCSMTDGFSQLLIHGIPSFLFIVSEHRNNATTCRNKARFPSFRKI